LTPPQAVIHFSVSTMTMIRSVLLLLLLLFTQLFIGNASSLATRLYHFQCRRNHAHTKSKSSATGTLLRFKRPTTKRVSTWFPSTPEPEFNHDQVGMTTPCLHIDLKKNRDSSSHVVDVSTTGSTSSDSNWWPASPVSKGWRRLRLSRRIGRGSSCYQAVRDAALEWEFDGKESGGGIVQVHSKQSHAEQLYQRRDSYGTGYDVVHNAVYGDGDLYAPSSGESAVKIWSGPGGRRLATYTQVLRSRWLPKVYCVNPVTVIYDLVDQRGPSTTYTSTAYATNLGHWLRGEERLTVAHRDDGNVDVEILSYSKRGNSVWGRIIWPFVGALQGRFFESQMNALQNVAEEHSNDSDDERQIVSAIVGPTDDTNTIPVRRW
jgi:uncharacterized protein (UPF0548 family)